METQDKDLKPLDEGKKTEINVKVSKGGWLACGFFGILAFLWKIIGFIGIVIAACLVAFALYFGIQKWQEKRALENYQENQTEATKNKGKLELQQEQTKEANQNVKLANVQTKQAAKDSNRRTSRDSSTYNGNFGTVNRRFCNQPEFANDSSCRK